MFWARKAQATTELVVLGTLVIMAFSYLINYSEKLNRQQANIQQTFRAALSAANSANNSAAYTKVAYRRMANVASPMELGQLQTFSSSANVLWGDGTNTDDPISKYQLNEDSPIDLPSVDASAEGTSETNNNTFTNTVDATTTFVRTNNTTIKTLNATDVLQADVSISGTTYSFTHSLGAGGKYYPGTGNKLDRSRSM